MLIQIILFLFLGILAGTLTGLIPGIHINTIGVFLIALSASLLTNLNPIYFVVFISSMSITHTFLDFIPSVFLGCPDSDTELSILPGHDLLKQGKAYEAIILTAYGSISAIFILILISYPSILIISKTYFLIEKLIPYILILASLILILIENKKFTASFVFIISGILGYIVLNLENLNQPLLPLLTGLFGSSALILSIKNKTKIPEQKITKPKTKILKPVFRSLIASPLCSFLPGMGSGQAAIIGNINSKLDNKGFLVLIGATNTLVMGFSFILLYIISKTRTGAAVTIKEILGNIETNILILILTIVFISGIISFFLTINLAKFFSNKFKKINYTFLSTITLIILLIIVFILSGFLGILILIISTFTGIYCIQLNIRRTFMMGCLMIPTILFYFL
ncbi:MAG: tripartite tricarboxylate transporter permease [Candidatus Pacearchaeota archaeon]|jgi:putative membrane protein